MVQDLLEAARDGLGKVDIRSLNDKDLVNTLKTFQREALQFDQDCNGAAEKSILNLMIKKFDKLFPLLDLEWNSSLAVRQGKWIFFKASPLKSNSKLECRVPGCEKVYTEPRSYQNHLRDVHKIIEKVPKSKVTCRLEHRKQTDPIQWDQISTHLKKVHGIDKPSKNHFVRGYESHDGGKTFAVVWKEPHESDPTSPSPKQQDSDPESRKKSPPKASLNVDPVPSTSTSASMANNTGSAAGSSCSRNLFGEFNPEQTESVNLLNEENVEGELESDVLNKVPLLSPCEKEERSGKVPESEPRAEDTADPNVDPEPEKPKGSKQVSPEPAHQKESQSAEEVALEVAAKTDVDPEKPKGSNQSSSEPAHKKESETVAKDIGEADQDFEPELKDLSDQFCMNEEFESAEVDLSDDSDVEEKDSKSFTQKRLRNKKKRYQMRDSGKVSVDLPSLPGNKEVIEEFCQFLSKKGDSTNPQSSTISKSTGYLFRHGDAFLPDMVKRRPDFKLEQLINFSDRTKFVHLKDPQSWVESIGGESGKENPSRQREFYKSHKQLRDFVIRKLNDADLGNDDEGIFWEQKIRSNLQRITEDVNGRNTWAKLDTGIQNKKLEVDQAKDVLSPRKNLNEANANSSYFSSQEYQSRAEKNSRAWKRAMEAGSISESAFNEFMNFSRHVLGKNSFN